MIKEIMQDAGSRMEKTIDSLRQSLSKIRTGRAHPSLLDHLTVSYYGSEMPISQVANIGVEDARTLTITPWEKQMVQAIEKSILKSDLGLNPATAGTVIRIPMPPLTQETRRELVKVVRHEGEATKVAIRNIRRDANSDFKDVITSYSIHYTKLYDIDRVDVEQVVLHQSHDVLEGRQVGGQYAVAIHAPQFPGDAPRLANDFHVITSYSIHYTKLYDGVKGSLCQSASGPGGTTSVCPANTNRGAAVPRRAQRLSTSPKRNDSRLKPMARNRRNNFV